MVYVNCLRSGHHGVFFSSRCKPKRRNEDRRTGVLLLPKEVSLSYKKASFFSSSEFEERVTELWSDGCLRNPNATY